MKQTAVEWYNNEIDQLVSMLITNQLSISRYNELQNKLLNKAIVMEKEQMKDMFDKGVERGYDCYHSNEWAEEPTSPNFEQCYNETFKSEKYDKRRI